MQEMTVQPADPNHEDQIRQQVRERYDAIARSDAGIAGIEVLTQKRSRQFISDWVPGRNAGEFVASATIQARKP